MARMTENELRISISNFNSSLEKAGSPCRLIWSPRNGYQGVDVQKGGAGGCQNVEAGTARECWNAANRFTIDECRKQRQHRLVMALAVLADTLKTKKQIAAYDEVRRFLPD